jgi:hypothetical protein
VACATIPEEARLLAHELFALTPIGSLSKRIETPRFTITIAPNPMFDAVTRLRFDEHSVDAGVGEVHALLTEHGRSRLTWWVSPSATPAGLADVLRARGMRDVEPPPLEPRPTAMVLVRKPRPGPADVVARPVESLEEACVASELLWESNELPEEARERARLHLPQVYAEARASGLRDLFVAFVDGEPAAAGSVAFCPGGAALSGAGTVPSLRGRGAYTALVRARWDAAVARGTPALAIQAGSMSRPILERLGFQSVGVVEVLDDDFSSSRAS